MAGKTHKNKDDLMSQIREKYPYFELYPEDKFTSINNILRGKCLIHGEEFTTTYNKINKYNPCKKCSNVKLSEGLINHDRIKRQINEIYGEGNYDLSYIDEYNKRINKKLKIRCIKHDLIFEKSLSDLIFQKTGCPVCSKENRKLKRTPLEVVQELEKLNKGYDYSEILKLDKISTNDKLPIICPKHGLFYQTYHSHLKQGCPKCYNRNLTFEEKFNNIPNNSRIEILTKEKYKATDKIHARCTIHGEEFDIKYNDLQQGHTGCEKCGNLHHKTNPHLKEFIQSLGMEVEFGNRKVLKGKELDVYFPSNNLAIEYNGVYWHSNEWLENPIYHKNKTDVCDEKNIQLIHIWEDDWKHNREIVCSIIKNKLNIGNETINACEGIVKEIQNKEYKEFLEINHLHGYVSAKIKLGLYFEDKLAAVLSLGKTTENQYKILRYCGLVGYNIVEGFLVLLSYFIKQYSPENIISYVDRDISNGKSHENAGFLFVKNTLPGCWCIKNNSRIKKPKQTDPVIPNIKTIYNSGNKIYEFKIK